MAINSEYPTNNYAPSYQVPTRRGFDPYWVLAGVVFVSVIIFQLIWTYFRINTDSMTFSEYWNTFLGYQWGQMAITLLVTSAAVLARKSFATRLLLLAYFPLQVIQVFTQKDHFSSDSSLIYNIATGFGIYPQDNGIPFWFDTTIPTSELVYINMANLLAIAKFALVVWCFIYTISKKNSHSS